MTDLSKLEVKRKMMFIKGEDFYYLTYNILILLHCFECYKPEKAFKDHRKLTYLIELMSDSNLLECFLEVFKTDKSFRTDDKRSMFEMFCNAKMRTNQITKLVFALNRNNHIFVDKHKYNINLWLNDCQEIKELVSSETYKIEISNCLKIKKAMPMLRIMSLETMLNKIFDENGVKTWDA